MNLASVADLSVQISSDHDCGCCYIKSVQVYQMYKGRLLWEGEVGVFKVFGHPLTTECYAWIPEEISGSSEPVIILKLGNVQSAKMAVERYIFQLSESLAAA